MRKILLGLLIMSLLPVSVVTAGTNTIGVDDSLSESTKKVYSDYVYNYNKIKEKVSQYEMNVLLNTLDTYDWWIGEYPEDATEEEIAQHTQPLGVFDKNVLNTYLTTSDERKAEFSDPDYRSDEDKFTPDEELFLSDIYVEYYYDYENNQLIQRFILSKQTNEFYKESWIYYIYNSDGEVLTYGKAKE